MPLARRNVTSCRRPDRGYALACASFTGGRGNRSRARLVDAGDHAVRGRVVANGSKLTSASRTRRAGSSPDRGAHRCREHQRKAAASTTAMRCRCPPSNDPSSARRDAWARSNTARVRGRPVAHAVAQSPGQFGPRRRDRTMEMKRPRGQSARRRLAAPPFALFLELTSGTPRGTGRVGRHVPPSTSAPRRGFFRDKYRGRRMPGQAGSLETRDATAESHSRPRRVVGSMRRYWIVSLRPMTGFRERELQQAVFVFRLARRPPSPGRA